MEGIQNTESGNFPESGSRLSIFATFVLFVLTPLLIAGWSLSKGLELMRQAEFQSFRLQNSQEIRTILTEATEEVLARSAFEMASIPGRFPMEIEKHGSFPPTEGQDPILCRLAEILAKKIQPGSEEMVLLKNDLGWGLNLSRLRGNPQFAFSASWGKKRGWLIWGKESHGRGKGSATEESVKVRLYVFQPLFSRLRWAVEKRLRVSGNKVSVINLTGKSFVRSHGLTAERVWKSLKLRMKEQVIDNDWGESQSHTELLGGGVALFLQTPFSTFDPGSGTSAIWKSIFVLIAIMCLLLPLVSRFLPGIGIRMKLLGMFGLAMALPLSGVYLLALGILADRRIINNNSSIQKIREEMMKFDDEYKSEEKRSLEYFEKFLRLPALAKGDFKSLESVVRDGIRKNWFERVEIRDWKNQRLLFIEKGEGDPGYDLLAETMSDRAIEEIVGSPETKKIQPAKIFTSSILETPEFSFSEIVRKPLKLHLMRFGNSIFYLFWATGGKPPNPFGYIQIIRNHRQAVVSYFQSRLVQNRPIKFFFRDRLTGRWFPRSPPQREIESIAQGVIRSGEDQVGRITDGGESFLAVGISPLNIEKFDLIGVSREVPQALSFKNPKVAIAGGMILAALVGCFCAWILARSLILPIRDLNQGIDNLRRRNADYRIPIRAEDELGKMAQAFNHMIETMGELDMAKVVQERLFPSKVPQIPGYQIYMKNQMISEIGGDYCDWITLKSGKTFFLIGDVSGHGVGAALMMAIAKSVVTLHFEEGGTEDGLLSRLNGVLFDLKASGQYMTFLGGILDPIRNTLSFTFAGHPFPSLYNAETDVVGFVEQKKYPLGIRRKQDFAFHSVDFPPGSAVLLYTDGMPESVDRSGKPFGYGRIKDLTKSGARLGAKSLIDLVEASLADHKSGLPFNDDLTLFAISRDSSGRESVVPPENDAR